MTDVETAKRELLLFARRHDTEREARRRPVRVALVATGVGILAARLLLGCARQGFGRRVMAVAVVARVAKTYLPIILRAASDSHRIAEQRRERQRPAPRATPTPAGRRLGAPEPVASTID